MEEYAFTAIGAFSLPKRGEKNRLTVKCRLLKVVGKWDNDFCEFGRSNKRGADHSAAHSGDSWRSVQF